MQTASCPEIGTHRGIPADQYHAWDAASNSRLSRLSRSPAHLHEYIHNPPAPTPALTLGSALHCLVLEPHIFADSFCKAEQCSAKTGKGEPCSNNGKVRRAGSWLCGTHDKAKDVAEDLIQVLTAEQWEQIHGMAASIRAHESASQLLGFEGDRELSLVWDDPETDVRCKARLDKLAAPIQAIVDLKSTTDASPREFSRSIAAYGYHRQAAHYLNAAAALGIDVTDFVVIAVEKSAPYAVAVYRLADDVVAQGRMEIAAHLATYRDCLNRESWPAYDAGIQDISLPAWAWQQATPSFESFTDEVL